ncbi:NINE protein [uncultured Corynebacterium sp.]|uniref:NINE protein n=1 Tax=uncultured Corynebacterium sp. TaxID=159447 RepID=UPI00259699FB|nr:NINE protein [uncultured Corynebacterium sp.]
MPGAYPAPYGQAPYSSAPKSKIVAALLFFFFGTFGIGNFYLHQNKRGVTKLVLSIVGFLTAILIVGLVILIALGIWAFVETILVLVGAGGYDRDGRGVPLD